MRWKAQPITKQVDEFFAAEFEGLDEARLELVRKLTILDSSVFEEIWLKVEGQPFDYRGCHFEDYEDDGQKGK